MKQPPHIKVYRFKDAPKCLQDLSTNGGDEDWVAVIPPGIISKDDFVAWLESPAFGCYRVRNYRCPEFPRHLIKIGYHA